VRPRSITPHLLAAGAISALSVVLFSGSALLAVTMPATVPRLDSNGAFDVVPNIPWLITAAVALLVAVRRAQNPVGWLLGAASVTYLLGSFGSEYLYHSLYVPGQPSALVAPVVIGTSVLGNGFPVALILLTLVFPDGRLLSRRWLIPVGATFVAFVSGWVGMLDPGLIGDGHRHLVNPLAVSIPRGMFEALSSAASASFFTMAAFAVFSLVIRYRRADSDQRQQVKWFGFGITVFVVALALGLLTQTTNAWTTPGPIAAQIVGFTALPLCLGVAVLKYRLYDIDVVISRALVYGTLVAFITAVYVGIVVGIGSLVGSGPRANLGLSILATAVIAIGFQPLRDRVQKLANRLVYGKRATPYEVLSEFSERVAGSYGADLALPRMAQVLADGTGAEVATVWLRSGTQLQAVASSPLPSKGIASLDIIGQILPVIPGTDRAVAVRHQGELLGALSLVKGRGESLSPVEEKLLDDLSNQAGLVLKNVGLTTALQHRVDELRVSRQRLVAAQDRERRQLERNLHDGAQQNLVAIRVKLGLAKMMRTRDPGKAQSLLISLEADTEEALATLQDLARGIYPPLLAERGLGAALLAQAAKATLPVTVDAQGIGRYPQEVEAAAYFCVLEALQNVQKYAGASNATVRLRQVDGQLQFEVADDGQGFDYATSASGSGLTNMADRVDALGGHLSVTSVPGCTRVCATIPGSVPEADQPRPRPNHEPQLVGEAEL